MAAQERLKDVTDAKRKIVEGSLTIWNARLEMLSQAGDMRGVHDLLTTAVEAAEGDGSCGNNCDCRAQESLSEATGPVSPGPKVK